MVTRRLVKELLPVFDVNTYGFQGKCSFSGTGNCTGGGEGGAVATLVTTNTRGRKTYKALCAAHAERHEAAS